MKNVNMNQLKKCIFFTLEDFEQTINEVFHTGGIIAEVSYDGLTVYNGATGKTYDTPEIAERLCEYFGINEIESIHADDCEMPGIWITYND